MPLRPRPWGGHTGHGCGQMENKKHIKDLTKAGIKQECRKPEPQFFEDLDPSTQDIFLDLITSIIKNEEKEA